MVCNKYFKEAGSLFQPAFYPLQLELEYPEDDIGSLNTLLTTIMLVPLCRF